MSMLQCLLCTHKSLTSCKMNFLKMIMVLSDNKNDSMKLIYKHSNTEECVDGSISTDDKSTPGVVVQIEESTLHSGQKWPFSGNLPRGIDFCA